MTRSHYTTPDRRNRDGASRGSRLGLMGQPSSAEVHIGGESPRFRSPRRWIEVLLLAIIASMAGPASPGFGELAADTRVPVFAERSVERAEALSSSDTLRIRLALAPRLHVPWARAEIIRPTDSSRRDVIVLTAESTLADLEKAVRMLASSHSTQPEPIAHEIRGHVSGTAQEPDPGPLLDVLDRGLRALPSGETASISEHGDLPSVELDLDVVIDTSESDS